MKKLFILCAVLLAATISPAFAQEDSNPMVVLHTNFGDITVEVFEDKAPITAANFLQYVKDGFYDGTIFHRVIPRFVIQGGGFTADYEQADGLRAPIENESDNGLDNERGTLSMARTPNPDSATSQFFVNLSDNPPLNHQPGRPGYAVFAQVTEGMNVVDQIARLETGPAGPFGQDVPQETVIIESAEVISD